MCVSVEPELPSYREPKYVDQNWWDGHENLNDISNHHDETALYQENSEKDA